MTRESHEKNPALFATKCAKTSASFPLPTLLETQDEKAKELRAKSTILQFKDCSHKTSIAVLMMILMDVVNAQTDEMLEELRPNVVRLVDQTIHRNCLEMCLHSREFAAVCFLQFALMLRTTLS